MTRASLYANTPLSAAAQAASWASQTLQNWFASDPSVMAAAALKGPEIYFRAAGVDASDLLFNSALLMHELIHNITGLTDSDIEARLHLPTKSSDWITSQLYDDCF